jgi:hypothetical protein
MQGVINAETHTFLSSLNRNTLFVLLVAYLVPELLCPPSVFTHFQYEIKSHRTHVLTLRNIARSSCIVNRYLTP